MLLGLEVHPQPANGGKVPAEVVGELLWTDGQSRGTECPPDPLPWGVRGASVSLSR